MNINGILLNNFDIEGIQLPFCGLMQIDNNLFKPSDDFIPQLGPQRVSAQKRTLIIDFNSSEGMSNFTYEASSKFILDIDDGYEYLCFLDGSPTVSQDWNDRYVAQYPLLTIKRKHKRTVHLSNGQRIYIPSKFMKHPCRYIIKANTDISEVTINGHIVQNLKKGDSCIIDGIDKKVTNNGANKFASCVLKDNRFPFLNPGMNEISIIGDVDVKLEYYEIWM